MAVVRRRAPGKTLICEGCGWTTTLDDRDIAKWTIVKAKDYCDLCSAKRRAKQARRKAP